MKNHIRVHIRVLNTQKYSLLTLDFFFSILIIIG